MRLSGRNIKRRLYDLRNLPSNLKRARYFRGHGVHSPFVYAVVRQVFMRSKLFPEGATDLYYELLARGISQRRAVQLQNLMTHCGYTSFSIDADCGTEHDIVRCDMMIATKTVAPDYLKTMAACAAEMRSTLCIMSPAADRRRDETCRDIVAAHGCTSIDNRGYLLIFNNYLPKQRFRL